MTGDIGRAPKARTKSAESNRGKLYSNKREALPEIPKHDRRRPWKTKVKGTKPNRAFHSDSTPVRPFENTPTGSETEPRLKSARWQRFRRAVIQRFPFCPICDAMGRTTPSTDCDHISPRHRNEFDLFDLANCWAICHECHEVKSSLERRGIHHETMQGWVNHVARIRRTGKPRSSNSD